MFLNLDLREIRQRASKCFSFAAWCLQALSIEALVCSSHSGFWPSLEILHLFLPGEESPWRARRLQPSTMWLVVWAGGWPRNAPGMESFKQGHQMGIRSLAPSCQVCKCQDPTSPMGSWDYQPVRPDLCSGRRSGQDWSGHYFKQLCLMAPEVLLGHSLALKAPREEDGGPTFKWVTTPRW